MSRASDTTPRRMPGEEGVWMFVFGDMLFFAAFFVTFVYYRAQNTAQYDQAQLALDQTFGLLNTLLLLTSSWFLALGLRTFRNGERAAARRLIAATGLLGACFVAAKGFEWADKFEHGITVLTDEFYMFYFMFTGIHLIHVLIGLGVLALMYRTAGDIGEGALTTMESGSAFWHLVDMLWVVLFALLYLMR